MRLVYDRAEWREVGRYVGKRGLASSELVLAQGPVAHCAALENFPFHFQAVKVISSQSKGTPVLKYGTSAQ